MLNRSRQCNIYIYTKYTCIHTFTLEYYLAFKMKEIQPFVAVWMNLEDVMLNEISQTQRDKCINDFLTAKSAGPFYASEITSSFSCVCRCSLLSLINPHLLSPFWNDISGFSSCLPLTVYYPFLYVFSQIKNCGEHLIVLGEHLFNYWGWFLNLFPVHNSPLRIRLKFPTISLSSSNENSFST